MKDFPTVGVPWTGSKNISPALGISFSSLKETGFGLEPSCSSSSERNVIPLPDEPILLWQSKRVESGTDQRGEDRLEHTWSIFSNPFLFILKSPTEKEPEDVLGDKHKEDEVHCE